MWPVPESSRATARFPNTLPGYGICSPARCSPRVERGLLIENPYPIENLTTDRRFTAMAAIVTEVRANALSAYGPARSTVQGSPLSSEEARKIHAYWRACNYLSLGMIYLQDNALLKEPLKPEHIKNRLLGHWGASPGLAFAYIHLNRVIKKFDLDMIFMAGPGHGAPGILGPCYLEGTYSEIYTDKSEDAQGLLEF